MGWGQLCGRNVLGVPFRIRCFLGGRGLVGARRRRLGLLPLLLLELLVGRGLRRLGVKLLALWRIGLLWR